MKRIMSVLFVMGLIFSTVGYAENDVESLFHQYYKSAEIISTDHILIVKADYDEVMSMNGTTPEGIENLNDAEKAQDYLKPYDFILLLLMKGDTIYMAAQIFVHDGIVDKTANGLMSGQYIQDNIRIGIGNP